MSVDFVPVHCALQHYDWGKPAQDSLAATLWSLATSQSVPADKPCAELWMGTHPSAPSFVMAEDGKKVKLSEFIQDELPYLFKVLSVNAALSIQAHPDKAAAEQLHKVKPHLYKDPNHKPEMAVALTPFEALCNFRPIDQIVRHVEQVPELSMIAPKTSGEFVRIGSDASSTPAQHKAALRAFYTELMTADETLMRETVAKLVERLTKEASEKKGSAPSSSDPRHLDVDSLVLRLYQQHKVDIGLFAPYLLNAFRMHPGEAIFLPPNEPHAYLSGDIVETMACSDNVVRAGLTPKPRDTDTLCAMLTYQTCMPPIMTGSSLDAFTRQYSPLVPEFRLDVTVLPAGGESKYVYPVAPTHALVLVLDGEVQVEGRSTGSSSGGQTFGKGTVIFVRAGVQLTLSSKTGTTLHKCFTPKDAPAAL